MVSLVVQGLRGVADEVDHTTAHDSIADGWLVIVLNFVRELDLPGDRVCGYLELFVE